MTYHVVQEHGDKPLRIKGDSLSKYFNTTAGQTYALNNVSIDIHPSEMVVLLGPSGCGKTTLLRSIAGLEQPQSGEIRIDDKLVYSANSKTWVPPEHRGISMVFQSYALWPHMTVKDNIAYPLVSRKVSKSDISKRVGQVMDAVGLGALGDRYPAQLSGGQQQRVALARAIASESRVVLFDEPLSNVDAKVRDQIRREIINLQLQLGFSGLYVTHDQVEAGALADKLVVMDHGRVAQVGPPSVIYDSPNTLYVATFMGPGNEFKGTVETKAANGLTSAKTPLGAVVGSARPSVGDAGSKVTILFRPEACVLSTAEPEGPNKWQCIVQRRTFMGAFVELWLSIGVCGQQVQLTALAPKHTFSEGTHLWVQVPPTSVWMFGEQ
ncbi:ABC-type spermidine/putrescine transport system, ATPase component [Hyphomicrobiales bacterium]|nr:ABC-type spermidine/putrescine transport system, ATPase component [Hyphomicrobiales bacterium]